MRSCLGSAPLLDNNRLEPKQRLAITYDASESLETCLPHGVTCKRPDGPYRLKMLHLDHATHLRLIVISGLLLSACSSPQAETGDPRSSRRHVLLVTVDTLRADYLSVNGYELPTTPFVDSLLESGVHFSNTVAPVPRTTQALASLLTGSYPHTTGVRTLYDRLAPQVVTVAEMLQERRYTTLAVVSNHVLIPERGLDRGFDVYDFADDARDAASTNEAVFKHLADRSPEERLFLWVHYIDPHVPYFPPPDLAAAFDPEYRGRYTLNFGTLKGGVGDLAYPADLPKEQAVFRNRLPPRVNAHIRRLYAADIRFTDDQIRKLVEGLRDGLGDDWLIVFTADHGESLGEHDFYYDHGDYVYNAGLRVPLGIVLPPADPMRRTRTVDDWVSLVDVTPTLMELLALPMLAGSTHAVEGRSLVPYLEGKDMAPRAVFAECGRSFYPRLIRRRLRFDLAGRFRTIVLGDWKLIWTPAQSAELEFELYNLNDDPNETDNLYVPGHREAERLKALLRLWLQPGNDGPAALTEDDAQRLRSLGYVR